MPSFRKASKAFFAFGVIFPSITVHVFENSRNVEMRSYFLRFFSRVRSSFIDIVGSFLLSSISFQKVAEV